MIPGLNKRVINFYDLMLYVALARKHLRLMVLLVCMCLLAGLAVYVYSRPVYYSRSLVKVDETPLPVDSDAVYHDSGYTTIIAEMKAPAIVERTASRLGVNADYRTIMRKYIRQLKIDPSPDGNGLEVSLYSYNPSWPAHWAEYMVDEFLKEREQVRQQYRDSITQNWGKVISEAGQKMDDNLDREFNVQDQSKLLNATIDMNRLRSVPLQLVQIKQRIDALDDVARKLSDPSLNIVARLSLIDSVSREAPLALGEVVSGTGLSYAQPNAATDGIKQMDAMADATPDAATQSVNDDTGASAVDSSGDSIVVPAIAGEPEWQTLDRQQRRIEDAIAVASLKWRPGNHHMLVLNGQLEAVQRSLELDYQTGVSRLNVERQSLLDQQQFLVQKLPEYQAINHQVAKLQQDDSLHNAGDLAWKNIISGAEQYISKLDYTADKERVNLEYMGVLELRGDPVSPNKLNLLIFAFAMGGMLAFAIPFLIEYLDFTLSNLEEVETTFQMRGLGVVPQLTNSTGTPLLLGVGDENGDRNLVENFRVVRTNLLAMGTLSKAPHVTMITSAMPKEGKTVISSNLAVSFVQMGEKTLLIDTDLRRGRLHRLFGLRKSPGLSDVLLGKVPLEDALRPGGQPNLTILSAGQHLESGTELLGSQAFTDLMAELRHRFQRIVMDTPPVLGLSETSILQPHVDGVLFVIWSGRTPIRNMKTALDILQANGANFYGFILNRLDLSSTANYYQYYYYSSDYYHSYHSLENA
jgi:capsular exopolysaccharide synthesis family protein